MDFYDYPRPYGRYPRHPMADAYYMSDEEGDHGDDSGPDSLDGDEDDARSMFDVVDDGLPYDPAQDIDPDPDRDGFDIPPPPPPGSHRGSSHHGAPPPPPGSHHAGSLRGAPPRSRNHDGDPFWDLRSAASDAPNPAYHDRGPRYAASVSDAAGRRMGSRGGSRGGSHLGPNDVDPRLRQPERGGPPSERYRGPLRDDLPHADAQSHSHCISHNCQQHRDRYQHRGRHQERPGPGRPPGVPPWWPGPDTPNVRPPPIINVLRPPGRGFPVPPTTAATMPSRRLPPDYARSCSGMGDKTLRRAALERQNMEDAMAAGMASGSMGPSRHVRRRGGGGPRGSIEAQLRTMFRGKRH
ncbi:MAG: hypothetical protein M1825_004990 [Sarcosagium campestre]|nr:MAG: hypothetical protein M1825_004990 [Sarcosagium campestre]